MRQAFVVAAALCALAQSAPATAGPTTRTIDGIQILVSRPDAAPAMPPAGAATRHRPAGSEREPASARTGLSTSARAVIAQALALIGAPYVFGGASPNGFDCSGFVQYVYARAGIAVPRTADVQFAEGRPIAGDPRPGDLVFFQTYDYGASHVGIYLGQGRFVQAIGSDVHVSTFDSEYFRSRYLGARRYL
ncbi:MAG: C40 family peptidase [Vulcanimicrobiaceae bacterium]